MNGTARSPASNEISIHVDVPVAPSAPAILLGLVNGSSLALAWTNTYTGRAPTSPVLDVTGSIMASIPLGLSDSFAFAAVPPGTYTLALRAQNAAGASVASNAVTLTFPGPCSGPPQTPASVRAYRVANTVFIDWAPAPAGPAPTGYVVNVSGSFVGAVATAGRALSGTVGFGSYTLTAAATNACGSSGPRRRRPLSCREALEGRRHRLCSTRGMEPKKTDQPPPPAGEREKPTGQDRQADSPASKPQGTLRDQITTMESEGQAQPQADELPPEERPKGIPPLPEPEVEGVGEESGPAAGKDSDKLGPEQRKMANDATGF